MREKKRKREGEKTETKAPNKEHGILRFCESGQSRMLANDVYCDGNTSCASVKRGGAASLEWRGVGATAAAAGEGGRAANRGETKIAEFSRGVRLVELVKSWRRNNGKTNLHENS